MRRLFWTGAALLLTMLLPVALAEDVPWDQVPAELDRLIATTTELAATLEQALGMQPDTSYWYGYTAEDFVGFFEEWLVYNPAPVNPALYIEPFDHLANSEGGTLLFANNDFTSWFISFLDARGQYLSSPASAVAVPVWLADTAIHIEDYLVPEGRFSCFSDYFLRDLRPGARPLDGEGDPSVIVSPADGTMFRILADDIDTDFEVKRDVLNIRQALNDSPYAERFIGGDIVDILLWFTDYHHYHAPVSGTLVEIGEYAGSYNYDFEHVDWYRDLARHKRLCYLIETEDFGMVAMIPVGFWGVGSCINERQVGEYVEKGDELGHFGYGGSSILLIFEPGAVQFIPEVTTDPIPVRVRAQIGVATGL
ncbi:MAG: phosphatidylserine decarboxylase [Bacillota bacterium]